MAKIQWKGPAAANAKEYEAALDPGPAVNPIRRASAQVLKDKRVDVTFESVMGRGGWVARSDAAAANAQEQYRLQSDAVAGEFRIVVSSPGQLAEAVQHLYAKARLSKA